MSSNNCKLISNQFNQKIGKILFAIYVDITTKVFLNRINMNLK
jgi:hypothetical protein